MSQSDCGLGTSIDRSNRSNRSSRAQLVWSVTDGTDGSINLKNLTMEVAPESQCGENDTELVLSTASELPDKAWIFNFRFGRLGQTPNDNGMFQAELIQIKFKTDAKTLPDVKEGVDITLNSTETWGKAPIASYYHCMAPKTTKLTSSSQPVNSVNMRLTNVKLQAFTLTKEPKFSDKETLCTEDQTPDNTVPIAVGVALAVCIVIALVVFIIFNRRNRRQYGSV
ncbi:unnamed protein product [Echinostoma caproni]|uniref:Lysosome-associated membrane glycoprotein 1 n=1 Tax=Echinostoma caproni TaxID=27848 RepID=A0A183AAY2_9TREM|nr:unnamed protein product [Echinostoma caproni]